MKRIFLLCALILLTAAPGTYPASRGASAAWRDPVSILLSFVRPPTREGLFAVEAFVQANVPVQGLEVELHTFGPVRLAKNFEPSTTQLAARQAIEWRTRGKARLRPGKFAPGISLTVSYDFPFDAMAEQLRLRPPPLASVQDLQAAMKRLEGLRGQRHTVHQALPIELARRSKGAR